MSREHGCCRFSGFTATAYPLRVEQGLPKEGATVREWRRTPIHGRVGSWCKLKEASACCA